MPLSSCIELVIDHSEGNGPDPEISTGIIPLTRGPMSYSSRTVLFAAVC